MKKAISLIAILISIHSLSAQEAEKTPKFNFISLAGIGFGVVDNDKEPNYNMNTNNGVLLLNYKFMKGLGVATGLGYNTLTGNGFNSVGNFNHERSLLQIPLLITADADISEQIRVLMNFGPYANYILKDEYRYIDHIEKDVYEGWNYGFQIGFGFLFNLDENFSLGLNYSGQSDLGEIKSDDSKGISDKQKIKYLNSIGVSFILDF